MNEIGKAKAYAALIGGIVTALLGTIPPETKVWQILTFVAAVCTAIATFAVPNKPKGVARDQAGQVDALTILLVLTTANTVALTILLFHGRLS